jgi:hypothetical protein
MSPLPECSNDSTYVSGRKRANISINADFKELSDDDFPEKLVQVESEEDEQ